MLTRFKIEPNISAIVTIIGYALDDVNSCLEKTQNTVLNDRWVKTHCPPFQ